MRELPLISICIPTYNGEKYLKECLDSVLAQTYTNIEIIISDDSSTDTSISIIEKYTARDTRVLLHRNSANLGLVNNWNKCLELAKGEWIKFVFQDDYIENNCIQEFVKEIDTNTVLMVSQRNFILPATPSQDYINYYTNVVRTLENTSSNREKIFSPQLISKIAVKNISLNFIGEPSLILFKKSIIEDVGIFNSSLKQICDLEFALKIASKYGLKYVPKKICAFRVHQDSTTSTNVKNKFFELHYIEPLLFSYFLLFDKHFQTFRSNLNYLQLQKLKLYFKVKVYKANRVNQAENYNHYLFRDSELQFKEISKNKKGNLFIKSVAAIFSN